MFNFSKISNQEKINFVKNLSVILKSGISINEALNSISKQSKNKKFSKVIDKIKNEVETGTPLSEALEKESKFFGNVFVSLIKAGESNGTLEENLDFLNNWLERDRDLKDKINAALLYPKIVIAATALLGGGLAVFILPKLTPLFRQLDVDLPLSTKILLLVSNFLGEYWHLTILGVVVAIILLKFISKIKFVRRTIHFLYLKIPFVSGIVIDYQMALVSQLLATLSRGGFSINETLQLTAEAATNIHYQEALAKMRKRVDKGVTLSEALNRYSDLFPDNFINIVGTGEKSGTLEASFYHLSEFYSREVNIKTRKLPTIIEPVLLIFIGLAVGFVALSIITPIYELTSSLSR